MDIISKQEDLPINTTMQVVEAYTKNKRKYYKVICPDCKGVIDVRTDAVISTGYKKQMCCRKCSYIRRDGVDQKGYSTKYTRLVYTYRDMLSRCYDTTVPSYKNYGAKGITVCDEWRNSLTAFVEWVLSLGFTYQELCERELDKDIICERNNIHPKIYSPSTCQFISRHLNNIVQPKKPNTTSQYIGVNWNKILKIWEWGVRLVDGTRKRGYGKTELEAAQKREQYIIANTLSHRKNNV